MNPLSTRGWKDHHLKVWPSQFAALLSGDKTHEVRRFDRDFHFGDDVWLYEYDPATCMFTGEYIRARIRHVTQPGEFGLPPDVGVFTIRRISTGGTSPVVAKSQYEMNQP